MSRSRIIEYEDDLSSSERGSISYGLSKHAQNVSGFDYQLGYEDIRFADTGLEQDLFLDAHPMDFQDGEMDRLIDRVSDEPIDFITAMIPKMTPQIERLIHGSRTNDQMNNIWNLMRVLPIYDGSTTNTSSYNRRSGDRQYENSQRICVYIHENLIGREKLVCGPFGPHQMVYCDFVASGRPLRFIEGVIRHTIMPAYANTHSEATSLAEQTNTYREESRQIIKQCVNATEHDKLIFTGSGSTAAINKMIQVLVKSQTLNLQNCIVFVSAFEHHSNILPWSAAGAQVGRIKLDKNGAVDMHNLEHLCRQNTRLTPICSLSAASNVTGILTDTDSAARILHAYNGLAFFDYATAAPYVRIDMNAPNGAYKDAVFISAHKFVGGPGSPGILVAKRSLFTNKTPTTPAGGTVSFVSRSMVVYTDDIEVKEEGGTPDIIGSIRAGLVFQLKASIGEDYIAEREDHLVKLFMNKFAKNKNLALLGQKDVHKLPIFSFVVRHPASIYLLHHNFIGLLLNDLFGLQSRPGCACAGPYAMDLLHIEEGMARKMAKYVTDCDDNPREFGGKPIVILKTGFVRVNLPYFYPDEELQFIMDAIEFVVDYGAYFLPQYTYSTETGFWRHRFYQREYDSIKGISYNEGKIKFDTIERKGNPPEDPLREAHDQLQNAIRTVNDLDFSKDPPILLDQRDGDLRWFLLPEEAAAYVRRVSSQQQADYS